MNVYLFIYLGISLIIVLIVKLQVIKNIDKYIK